MQIKRRKSRIVRIGKLVIGGNNPIAIQSMAKTKTADVEKTLKQIQDLALAGCEIVRVAVKDESDARAIRYIKKGIEIPLVADIHFDWRLALLAMESGADKIRLNPGNIYARDKIKEIARAARLHRIPIRVGLNSGSLKTLRTKGLSGAKKKGIAAIMVKEALSYLGILEKSGFYNIVVSLKGSDILDTIAAYRSISKRCDYPLHLGVTASGLPQEGAIKSSIAIGALLLEGIGDTIRISLTDQPQEEIRVARCILQALGLRNFGYEVISCPTCGRCEVDLISKVRELEKRLAGLSPGAAIRPRKIAMMGCIVNGPGEAREADIGVAFGNKEGLLFKKGKAMGKVSFADCLDILLREVAR
jgi:(E)-4-hydroxy-3-methylbut-2-enyl-diphosphate synthase